LPEVSVSLPAPPHCPPERSPFVLAQAVIAGQFDAEVMAWLQAAFRQRERQQGALPLDRYLKLPTFKAMRRERRDYWLDQAALHVDAPHETARHETVADELRRFMTRGPWPAWRQAGAAPANASELQRCLFNAASNHDGRRSPCAKTVERSRRSRAAAAATNSPWEMSAAPEHTGQQPAALQAPTLSTVHDPAHLSGKRP
jgi:hypothetical protein